MTEPLCKVRDVVYPRLRAPDLDAMEVFLSDFGMLREERTADALYMRGAGGGHPLHITERGDPEVIGFAFLASGADDLERLSSVEGASGVHEKEEPGGGRRVTLTDPDGFQIEVLHGIDLPKAGEPLPLNLGSRVDRRGEVKRVERGPARVQRLGHVGINTADPDAAFEWYHRHFGILKSDSAAIGDLSLAHFCRCDRGSEHTDHHSFLLARSPDGKPGLNHASWEVRDLDDIWLGHEHLTERGYKHSWGSGVTRWAARSSTTGATRGATSANTSATATC